MDNEPKFKHLTLNDRLTIERLLLKKYPKKCIADTIGCSLRTIYYEIKRATYVHTNPDLTEEVRYSPEEAERRYRQRLKAKGRTAVLKAAPELAAYISFMIKELHYSPEAVVYELRNNMALRFDIQIRSANTIYRAIRKGYFPGIGMAELPRKGVKVKRKEHVVVQKAPAAGTSIEKRPKDILLRSEFGHWEMDSLVGKSTNRKTVLVLTERKTRFEIVEKMKEHTSSEVVRALNRLEKKFKSDFYTVFKSITVDNGSEFKCCDGIGKALYRKGKRTNVYYCHPRSPQERGSNENANILLRRFLPKGADFDTLITRSLVKDVQFWINTYPRRLFKGRCTLDLFEEELRKLELKPFSQ